MVILRVREQVQSNEPSYLSPDRFRLHMASLHAPVICGSERLSRMSAEHTFGPRQQPVTVYGEC